MVNKKGFIRTLEAVIAIVLILGFIFYITPKVVEFEEKVPENVANAKEFILNQILFNKEYSSCIISAGNENCETAITCDKNEEIKKLFKDNVPYGYEYACEICSSDSQKKPCINLPEKTFEKSVYTNSIFIYKPTKDYNIMRIYIWKA